VRRPIRRRSRATFRDMMAWIAVPVLTLLLVVVALTTVSRHYRVPQVPHTRTPSILGIGFDEIHFPTAHGKSLYGWWIPAGEAPHRGAATLVMVHGWGRNVDRVLPFVRELHEADYDLLAFDARSHGSSENDGTANMLKFSEDIRAALDEAERRGARTDRLGVLGLSVGGAAALHAAAHDRRIRAVVTVGAFANPGDLMRVELRAKRVPALLVPAVLRYAEYSIGARLDEIAPEHQIAAISAPVLLVHGEDDATVPVAHARRLAAAGGGSVRLLMLPGRGHSDCNHDPRFWPEVKETLSTALSS
jgi:pimeloyl-ACP methyl ester carboxylesterase